MKFTGFGYTSEIQQKNSIIFQPPKLTDQELFTDCKYNSCMSRNRLEIQLETRLEIRLKILK